jgi:hypothetical protein
MSRQEIGRAIVRQGELEADARAAEENAEMRLNDEAWWNAQREAREAIGVSSDWDPDTAQAESTRAAACAKPAKEKLTRFGIAAALIALASGLVLLVTWRPRRQLVQGSP